MNAITSPAALAPQIDTLAADAPARRSTRRGGARRLIAVLLALLSMLGIGGVATASQASASTAAAQVTICWRQGGGGAFTGPTSADVWNGYWRRATLAGTNSGCRTWNVPGGYAVRFAVDHTAGSSTWRGMTGNYTFTGGYYYNLGYGTTTWTVR